MGDEKKADAFDHMVAGLLIALMIAHVVNACRINFLSDRVAALEVIAEKEEPPHAE